MTFWSLIINPWCQPVTRSLLSVLSQWYERVQCADAHSLYPLFWNCPFILDFFLRKEMFSQSLFCLPLPAKLGCPESILCFLFICHPSRSLLDADCGVNFHESTSVSNKYIYSIFVRYSKGDKSCMSCSSLFIIVVVSLLCVCVFTVWPLPPAGLKAFITLTTDPLSPTYMYTRTRLLGAGSQVTQAEWTLMCSVQ